MNLPSYFQARIEVTDSCWLWTGNRDKSDYGIVWDEEHYSQKAHRVVYELLKGEIPTEWHIHHLCHVPACVNPEHLQPLNSEDHARVHGLVNWNTKKTHCPKGHPYDEANTRMYRGMRYCIACKRIGVKP